MAKSKQLWFLVEEKFEHDLKELIRDINYFKRPERNVSVASFCRDAVEKEFAAVKEELKNHGQPQV